MGRRRSGRDIHGVLLLDKPTDISSNDALQKVRRLFNANKAGHTGALDPLATGMLPICLGEATKFSQFLLDSDKRYRVIARLGQRTDTSDSHGEIISERNVEFTQQQLDDALNYFRGDTLQVPSMYSALKHQGRPLYEYARKGITIEREARPITVYELQFIGLENNELELEVHCSKGTYIRTIIDDLGEMLGCGAHVIYLRRLQVANYPYEKMVTLEQLAALRAKIDEGEDSFESLLDSLLLPMDTAVIHFPTVNLTEDTTILFQLGQPVHADIQGLAEGDMLRVTSGEAQRFIGIALVSEDGRVAPKRLVVENEPSV
ncbi:tRNA pseudouridine(55) synthase TruB [Providencia sp.]|uniref:tRNA pseudouridine(55) synthase TruB n=1 Tax=Providencia sp. TaxID=589 RepID=UPI000E89568E|nr:tRNA pseudouridine(55) synthase TruB [Providencia sp.]MBP6082835.1 tRNA pseudouridine(55) synthase TruB [Providencia sp.]HBO22201.1 tRNA pseudouridine(55) synthase TruB [Providencia sp.]